MGFGKGVKHNTQAEGLEVNNPTNQTTRQAKPYLVQTTF